MRKSATVQASSDQIHNQNCWLYLKTIKEFAPIPDIFKECFHNITDNYNDNFPYADRYQTFMLKLEQWANAHHNTKGYQSFIRAIFHNDNGIINQTNRFIIQAHRQLRPHTNDHRAAHYRREKGPKVNQEARTPGLNGRFFTRCYDFFVASDVKPMQRNNIPTVKSFRWYHNHPQELRFGCVVNRSDKIDRVDPIFRLWLSSLELPHLYVNLIKRDKGLITDVQRNAEADKCALLEGIKHDKLWVITLPADQGLMDSNVFLDTSAVIKYDEFKNQLIHFLKGVSVFSPNDFYISQELREIIFNDESIYSQLVDEAMELFPFHQRLSKHHQQAILIHLTRVVLIKHILSKTSIGSFNFSCMDAIDRGGLSSSWYNLINSFASEHPITRDEFEASVHAPAYAVKGRPMNHHFNSLWNAVDLYLQKNHLTISNDEQRKWLILWRDMNCPHKRVPDLLMRRIQNLNQIYISQSNEKSLLQLIQRAIIQGLSGECLMLEALGRLEAVVNGDEDELHAYKELFLELNQNTHPHLKEIALAMKPIMTASEYKILSSKSNKPETAIIRL